jgi:hypothetical protein
MTAQALFGMQTGRTQNIFSRSSLTVVTLLLGLIGFAAFRHNLLLLEQSGFVHFPFWDDWDTPLRYLHVVHSGDGNFLTELFTQHNESRKVTTKLLSLLIDRFTVFHSDFTLALSYGARAATVAILCLPLLMRRIACPLDWLLRLGVIAFALHLYAVGPAALINGLWYVQISLFLGLMFAMACLSALALSLARARSSPSRRDGAGLTVAGVAGLTGVLSIFSFSGNVLLLACAPLSIGLMAVPPLRGGPRRQLRRILHGPAIVVLASLAVGTALFFLGYKSPPHHAHLRAQLPSIRYVLAFLANVYQHQPPVLFSAARIAVGLLLLALAGVLSVRLLGLWRAPLSWPLVQGISQACFLVGLALLSALGRAGGPAGANYALSSRYNSLSLLFIAVVAVLLVTLLHEWQAGALWGSPLLALSSRSWLALAALALLVVSGLQANAAWWPVVVDQVSGRRKAQDCLREVVSRGGAAGTASAACAAEIYPKVDLLVERFSSSWCRPAPPLPSRTIRSLCVFLAPSPQSGVAP